MLVILYDLNQLAMMWWVRVWVVYRRVSIGPKWPALSWRCTPHSTAPSITSTRACRVQHKPCTSHAPTHQSLLCLLSNHASHTTSANLLNRRFYYYYCFEFIVIVVVVFLFLFCLLLLIMSLLFLLLFLLWYFLNLFSFFFFCWFRARVAEYQKLVEKKKVEESKEDNRHFVIKYVCKFLCNPSLFFWKKVFFIFSFICALVVCVFAIGCFVVDWRRCSGGRRCTCRWCRYWWCCTRRSTIARNKIFFSMFEKCSLMRELETKLKHSSSHNLSSNLRSYTACSGVCIQNCVWRERGTHSQYAPL